MSEIVNEKSSDPNGRLYNLGILFVHGIGQPARGDTLVRFGDSLCEWIIKWLDGAKPDQPNDSQPNGSDKTSFELREAFIHPQGEDLETPPHVEWHLQRTSNAKTVSNTWLVAESWWPKSFITPRYRDLAWWGLLILPGASASHCGEQGYRWWKRLLPFLFSFGKDAPVLAKVVLLPMIILAAIASFVILTIWYITFSLVVALVLLVVFVLLLVLAIPPIPRLRSVILSVQQTLVGTVGDSYVFVTSPIQETAIVSRLVSDIRWMTSKCKRLAIVAHSQGAAIAHWALRTGVVREFDESQVLLLTFGSGLKKLENLKRKKTDIALRGWLVTMGLILLLIWLIAFTEFDFTNWPPPHSDNVFTNMIVLFEGVVFIYFPIVGAVLWLFIGLGFPIAYRFEADDLDPIRCFGIRLAWFDYYASLDPVPNGPLFAQAPEYLRDRSIEVHNYSAPWSDHTTYWKNEDGFVGQIARVIARFVKFPLIDLRSCDDERLSLSMHRRRWRVSCLMAARVFACMTAVGLLIGNRKALIQIGSEISTKLQAYWNVSLSRQNAFIPLTDAATQYLVGAAGVVLLVLLGYFAVYATWWCWNSVDTKAIFVRSEYKLWPFWLFVSLCLLLFDIAVFARFGWLTTLIQQPEVQFLFFAPPSIAAFAERALVAIRQSFQACRRSGLNILTLLPEVSDEMLTAFEPIFARILFLFLLTAPVSGWAVLGYTQGVKTLIAALTIVDLGLIWVYESKLREMLRRIACLGNAAEALQRLS
jgi:membrane-bound metal-dependent hydrolase YbcI (DUF457 family)